MRINILFITILTVLLIIAVVNIEGKRFDIESASKETIYPEFAVSSQINDQTIQIEKTGVERETVISVFPWFEGFEDDSPTREHWSQIQESSNSLWTFSTGSSGGAITQARSGNLNAVFTSSANGPHITKLITPVLDLSGMQNPAVDFWYGQEEWFTDQNELKVYYRDDPDNAWIEIFHDSTNRSVWTQLCLILPDPSSTYQIAFEGIDNWGMANVLDDVRVFDMTIIFSEGFAETVFPPGDWAVTQLGQATTNWTRAAAGAEGTSGSAYHDDFFNDHNSWLVSPGIELPEANTVFLFFHEKNQYFDFYDYSGVWLSTESGNAGHHSFFEIYESNTASPNWTSIEIDISQYAGNEIYLAFVYQGNYAHRWWIDEVIVTSTEYPGYPANPSPPDGSIDVPINGLLSWDFGDNTDSYDLWFGEAGSMSEVVSGLTAGSSGAYLYPTLESSTDYQWQVVVHNNYGTTFGPVWSFTAAIQDFTVIFGTGEQANLPGTAAPINITYHSLRGQMVYHAAELWAAGIEAGFLLTHFGFYIVESPLQALPNFRIRMRHTDSNDVSEHIEGPYQEVYFSHSYSPVAGDWEILELNDSFVWNGVDNILVDTAFSPVPYFSIYGSQRIYDVENGFRFTRNNHLDQTNVPTTEVSSNKPQAWMQFSPFPGMGTSDDPYRISTLSDLQWLSSNALVWDKHFVQTADIDASDTADWNEGLGFSPIGRQIGHFTGNYNGNGHTITGLTINRPDVRYIGFFGFLLNAEISNLHLVDVNITGGNDTAALAGYISNSTIFNCSSSGTINMTEDWDAGGLIGWINNNSIVDFCYSSCTVTGTDYVGGLAADLSSNSVLSNSYSRGAVQGNNRVGGLLGSTTNSTIDFSYSAGQVSGTSNAGGLVGFNNSSSIDNSFWDTETSLMDISAGGSGKTTSEMKDIATYTSLATPGLDIPWDFTGNPFDDTGNEDIWNIYPSINDGYPFLSWQAFVNIPVLAVYPENWCFRNVELMNPVTKEFVLSNGNQTGIVIVEEIGISGINESAFSLSAPETPFQIEESETVIVSVTFNPQSTGMKEAEMRFDYGLDIFTTALSGQAIEEAIGQPVNLTAEVTYPFHEDVVVRLAWDIEYQGAVQQWLVWNNGFPNRSYIVNDDFTINALIKFGVSDLAVYEDEGFELTRIRFMPSLNEGAGALSYNVRVWTGDDQSVFPSNVIVDQIVTDIVFEEWNEVRLDTPVTVTGTEPLWAGVQYLAPDGRLYIDEGPNVPGKGGLIRIGNTWMQLSSPSSNANWMIEAYIEPALPETGRAQILSSSGNSDKIKRTELPAVEHGSFSKTPVFERGNDSPRVLQGYNIYRNDNLIAELVQDRRYFDLNIPDDVYNYYVKAVYHSANSAPSNFAEIEVSIPEPFSLPFSEDWSSGTVKTNHWDNESIWNISTMWGNPVPSVIFSPVNIITDYDLSLYSWQINGVDVNSISAQFDLNLVVNNPDTVEQMAFEVYDGTEWQSVEVYNNQNDNIHWETYLYDISEYASDRIFNIRFRAFGEDTSGIHRWGIDNVSIFTSLIELDPPQDISVQIIGDDIMLTWDIVDGASSYYIYSSDNPYPEDWGEPVAIVGTEEFSEPLTERRFYRVTASTGEPPILSRTPELQTSQELREKAAGE